MTDRQARDWTAGCWESSGAVWGHMNDLVTLYLWQSHQSP